MRYLFGKERHVLENITWESGFQNKKNCWLFVLNMKKISGWSVLCYNRRSILFSFFLIDFRCTLFFSRERRGCATFFFRMTRPDTCHRGQERQTGPGSIQLRIYFWKRSFFSLQVRGKSRVVVVGENAEQNCDAAEYAILACVRDRQNPEFLFTTRTGLAWRDFSPFSSTYIL